MGGTCGTFRASTGQCGGKGSRACCVAPEGGTACAGRGLAVGRPVASYDVMNEPMGAPSKEAVWAAYASLYAAIRSADPDHMLFMEGTFYNWNWDMLPAPSLYGWTNVVYELHEYQGQSASAAQIMSGADAQAVDFAKHASWNVPGYIGSDPAWRSPESCR